jgi:hypothetical protein
MTYGSACSMMRLTKRIKFLDAERRRYTLETLASHLDDAGQYHRLHALFSDPEWMNARVRYAGFRYDGCVADLAVAFRNATERARFSETALVQAFRIGLISSTIKGLAGSLHPGLIAEAVKRSIWPAAQAIGITRSLNSRLDRQALCWALLKLNNLAGPEQEELRQLLDSARSRPHYGRRPFWLGLRKTVDGVQGGWVARDVVERSIDLLCALGEFLTGTLQLDGVAHEVSMFQEDVHEDPDAAIALDEFLKSSPKEARCMLLSKRRSLRLRAARGFLAISSVPGVGEIERQEAAALLSVALEPATLTVGVAKTHLSRGSRLLDADAVERVAPQLSAIQARVLIRAVLDSRARVEVYKGNPNRARALAVLARRLPAEERAPVYREAIHELVRLHESVQEGAEDKADRRRAKRKPARKTQKRLLRVKVPGARQAKRIAVYFDDYAPSDEGMDISFSNFEDLSDLEMEYGSFAAALESLQDVIPQELVVKLLGLAIYPLHRYGWVCVHAICALDRRFTGELQEIHSKLLKRALETLSRLPKELQNEHWWRLAPILDNDLLTKALGEHHVVHDETQQMRTFAAISPRLGADLRRDQAKKHLKSTGMVEDESEMLRALAAVAPLLDSKIEQRAVELALGMRFAADQMKGIAILASHLTSERRRTAVAEVRKRSLDALPDTADEDKRLVEGWAALMPFLEPPLRARPLDQVVGLIKDQRFPSDFANGVRLLGPYLTAAAVDRLEGYQWEIAKDLQLLIRSCAGHLYSVAEKTELLRQIRELANSKDRLDCLLELIPHLRVRLREKAAEDAWGIAMEREDCHTVSKLIEFVSAKHVFSKLLELDLGTSWAEQVIPLIASRLTRGQRNTLLAKTADLPNCNYWRGSLPNLADSGRAKSVDAANAREAIARRFAILHDKTRTELLAACTEPEVSAIFSDSAIADIARHMIEICQTWQWP